MKRRQTTVSKKNKNARVSCNVCSTAMRLDTLGRHLKTHNLSFPCQHCKKMIRSDKLLRHDILCRDKIDDKICHRSGVECLPDPLVVGDLLLFSQVVVVVENNIEWLLLHHVQPLVLQSFLPTPPLPTQPPSQYNRPF